jgi:CheY-like chemotaxis protein
MIETRQFRAHVLVIDDSRVDAMMLEQQLKISGCYIEVVDDVGFAEKQNNPYDIVFVDINMPSMNGFALANTIRQSSLAIKHVPIIAVSGNKYSGEQVENCLQNGLDGYVKKPVALNILGDILAEFLPDKETAMHKFSSAGDIRLKGFFRKRKIYTNGSHN